MMHHISVFTVDPCNGSGAGTSFIRAPTGRHREVVVALSSIERGTYHHSLRYKMAGDLKRVNSLALDVAFRGGKRIGGRSMGIFSSSD